MKAQAIEELSRLKESYIKGLDLCRQGDWGGAEKELVKVLKPVLSKPSMKSIHISLEDIKSETLDTMYHLGLVYLNRPQYFEYHAKAATIFQYCAAFSIKYKVGNTEYFLKEAHAVEESFLKSIGLDIEDYTSSRGQVEDYRRELENLRIEVKQSLEKIDGISVENIGNRAEKVQKIYERCNSFFVNHNTTDQTPGLIQRMLEDCYKQLGGIPEGCEHTVIGLGSLSLGTMTLWSDLEFAILVNDAQYKDYFRNLSKLLHIKIINLGETHLKSVGVESLNNFKSANPKDEWFWDDVMKIKFNFDSARHNACKVALGRQGGYQVVEKVKDENGIEQTTIVTKPDYELILTPEEMAAFQKEESNWFNTDKHLVQALLSPCLIDGSQNLLDCYREEMKKVVEPQLLKNRALEILAEDINRFSLKIDNEEEGKLIDTKQNIYRLGDRVVSGLADYYDIVAEGNEPTLNVWQMIDALDIKGIISEKGKYHLKEAVAIATELRLRTYMNNDTREENLLTYVPAVDHLSEEQKHKFLYKTFHFHDTSILHHFYYVMLSTQTLVKMLCNAESTQKRKIELELKSNPLFDNNDYNKAVVHMRFLEYDKALMCIEATIKKRPESLNVLKGLFFLYSKTAAIEKAMTIALKILELEQDKHQDNLNHSDIADSYAHLGNAYLQKGVYDEAIKYYNLALDIGKKLYSSSHPTIAMSYNNLGTAYGSQGEYDNAIKYYNLALESKFEVYTTGRSCSIMKSYNGLGNAYNAKDHYDEAIMYYNLALDIMKKVCEAIPDHPDIANTYNNLGVSYFNKGNYDESLRCHSLALKIQEKVYKSSPGHLDIAGSYNGLGNAYYHKKESYDDALRCYDIALTINLKVYESNSNHHDIAVSYNNLGKLCSKYHKYAKAVFYLTKANDILLDLDHPDLSKATDNLGVAIQGNREQITSICRYHSNEGYFSFLLKYLSYDISLTVEQLNEVKEAYTLYRSLPLIHRKVPFDEFFILYPYEDNPDFFVESEYQAGAQKELSRSITNFQDIPNKEKDAVRIVSYNITADFYDSQDKTEDNHHHWHYRGTFVKQLLRVVYPDIIALQELSPEQGLELHQYLHAEFGYESIFLSQTPSDIEAGTIVHGEEIKEWQGKFMGTPPLGIFIKKSFQFLDQGRFWLNENPELVPHERDRGDSNKGFGNVNSYKAVLWAKIQTYDSKVLFVFNSHYPLSGNNKTRFECVKLEKAKIHEITQGGAWVSTGDRNIIPGDNDNDLYTPQSVYDELIKDVHDIRDNQKHYGISTTWIGFLYDQYRNIIEKQDFRDTKVLDVMVSNLMSVCSFHHHGAFNPRVGEILPLSQPLTEDQNEQCYFASDHALIGADFMW